MQYKPCNDNPNVDGIVRSNLLPDDFKRSPDNNILTVALKLGLRIPFY